MEMSREVFVIEDKKAGVAMDPITSFNSQTVQREIAQMIKNGRLDPELARDCSLWHIGTYDPVSKIVDGLETPIEITSLAPIVEVSE